MYVVSLLSFLLSSFFICSYFHFCNIAQILTFLLMFFNITLVLKSYFSRKFQLYFCIFYHQNFIKSMILRNFTITLRIFVKKPFSTQNRKGFLVIMPFIGFLLFYIFHISPARTVLLRYEAADYIYWYALLCMVHQSLSVLHSQPQPDPK